MIVETKHDHKQLIPIYPDECIIFLDVDGVLNCQLFYTERHKKRKGKFPKRQSKMAYYKDNICSERLSWLNGLCEEVKAKVVISSSWRHGKTVKELRAIFKYVGATFEIIDKTPNTNCERGTEISKWLSENIQPENAGCHSFDFHRYAIIDDDSDMLWNQRFNFFQTDNYSGLTPNTCYKIKRFMTGKTFGLNND